MDKEVRYIEQDTSLASEYLPKQRSLKGIFIDIKRKGSPKAKDLDVQELHQLFKKKLSIVILFLTYLLKK